jgi:hypothetical protein
MARTFQDVIDVIEAAERSIPVNEWQVAGIQVWPLVRVRLYFSGLSHDFDAANTTRVPRIRLPRSVAKLADMARGALRKQIASLRDRGGRRRPARPAAVFLSDGVSFAKFHGKWIERFCDPLIEALREVGIASDLWVPTHYYHAPRYSTSDWIQPQLDRAQLHAALRSSAQDRRDGRLPGYDEFLSLLRARGFATHDLAAARISMDATRIAAGARYFRGRLRALQPRLAFVVSYYSIEGYALIKACKDLAIPTVDLQHGVQGRLHPAYGRFTAVPAGGYELLPDYFWTWSALEARVIEEWSVARGIHKVVVGGNPWLETWLAADIDPVLKYDQQVRRLQEATGARRHVLVTLQTGLSFENLLDPLAALARRAGAQWHWWIRLHPGMHGFGADVAQRLSARGMSNFDVDAASNLPLYALLRNVNLHVTYSSSVVLEAAAFGVPSFVCSETGNDLFAHEIEAGQARYLRLEAQSAVEELESFASAAPVLGRSERSRSQAALGELCRAAGIEHSACGGQR